MWLKGNLKHPEACDDFEARRQGRESCWKKSGAAVWWHRWPWWKHRAHLGRVPLSESWHDLENRLDSRCSSPKSTPCRKSGFSIEIWRWGLTGKIMSPCSFLVCIYFDIHFCHCHHGALLAVVRWKCLRIETKLSFVAGADRHENQHKDMDMVGLEKNGQLCEAMFHLCFWKFQDSHESVLKLVLGEQPFALNTCFSVERRCLQDWGCGKVWRRDSQIEIYDHCITGPCIHVFKIIFERAANIFCLLTLSQNLRQTMGIRVNFSGVKMISFHVWSHGLIPHSKLLKVMHVGFGMKSVYPGLLGWNLQDLRTVQRGIFGDSILVPSAQWSAGSLCGCE